MARRKRGNPVNGWVNFDKPLGMTSAQAVGKVRWLYGAQKAGHAGTLDPLATGILPIALGEATKTVSFMVDATKGYDFTVKWGERTNTLDAEGETVATSPVRPTWAQIQAVLAEFIGNIEQIPPQYSAIKIDGKRAYDLARAGDDPKMRSRLVYIDDITLVAADNLSASFSVICQKGTYIRSLARDLAHALGSEGTVIMLRRTQVGPFHQTDAFTLDVLEELRHKGGVSNALLAVATALVDIPALAVTADEKVELKHGRAIQLLSSHPVRSGLAFSPMGGESNASLFVLAVHDNEAVALCQARDGQWCPKRVFNM